LRAVIQRVSKASVSVDGGTVCSIGKGLLVLLCAMEGDGDSDVAYISKKILGLRIFPDENDKMNLNISAVSGSVLIVSQFTLAGDVRRGNRPSFTASTEPDLATELIKAVSIRIEKAGVTVEHGVFGAHMNVSLVNDGPVTILLDSERLF